MFFQKANQFAINLAYEFKTFHKTIRSMKYLEIFKSFSQHAIHAMKLQNKSSCFIDLIDWREVSGFIFRQ